MDRKGFKYNNEDLIWEKVSISDCKGCKHAKEDLVVNGKVIIDGSSNMFCEKYKTGNGKPLDIVDGKRPCEYKTV